MYSITIMIGVMVIGLCAWLYLDRNRRRQKKLDNILNDGIQQIDLATGRTINVIKIPYKLPDVELEQLRERWVELYRTNPPLIEGTPATAEQRVERLRDARGRFISRKQAEEQGLV